jgi:hypothetical protein
MIYFACAISVVLFWILRRVRKRMEAGGRTREFAFLLVDNALRFLMPFMGVTLFYVGLSLLTSGGDDETIALLRKYEHLLDKLSGLLKQLKLTPIWSLFVLIIAFVLTLIANPIVVFRPYKPRIKRLHSFLEKYHKWIGRVATVVTLLSSFTFFGGTVPRERARLEVAIKDLREKGEAFRNTLDEEVRERVAADLMHALPFTLPNFRPIAAVYEEIDKKHEELVREKEASAGYRIESPETDAVSADLQSRKEKIATLFREEEITTEPRENASRKYEGSISKSKLYALQKDTKAFATRAARVAKETFETPLGSRLGTGIIKLLISERHIPALQTLTAQIPITGPLLSILTESVRKKASILIENTTDSLAAALFEKPNSSVRDAINSSANDVSIGILKGISVSDLPTFEVETSLAQIDLAKVDAAEKDFHTRFQSAKNLLREQNQNLINRLRHPIEMRNTLRMVVMPIAQLTVNDLDGKVVAPAPRMSALEEKEQRRIDRAVEQLIVVAIGMNELAQNRLLTKIADAVSPPTLSLQVIGLTEITHEHLGSVADTSLREVAESLKPPEIRRAETERFMGRSFESRPIEVFRARPMPRR